MLDIWQPVDEAELRDVLEFHAASAGERFNLAQVVGYRSTICPYPSAEIFRIEISPHLVSRPAGNAIISAAAVSYFLLKRNADGLTIAYTIPFMRDMASIIAVNKIEKLKLTAESIRDYVTLIGILMSRPSFYFVTNLSQIDTLLRESTDRAEAHVRDRIEALFRVDAKTGEIQTGLKEVRYPVLGTCFRIRVPCIFSGRLAAAVVRISENGTPTMDEDQPFNIEGIIDRDVGLAHYPLDMSSPIEEQYHREIRAYSKWINLMIFVLAAERILSLLLFPLFLFNIFFAIRFGQDSQVVRSYFASLQESSLLSILSLVGGLAFVLVFSGRLILFHIVDYTNSLVPNPFNVLTNSVKTQYQAAAKNLGLTGFMIVGAVEFTISAILALTLMGYGLLNLFAGVTGSARLDFWTTFAMVLWAVPLFGNWLLQLIFSPTVAASVKSAGLSTLFTASIGFVYSTVLLGLLAKMRTYARSSDDKA